MQIFTSLTVIPPKHDNPKQAGGAGNKNTLDPGDDVKRGPSPGNHGVQIKQQTFIFQDFRYDNTLCSFFIYPLTFFG